MASGRQAAAEDQVLQETTCREHDGSQTSHAPDENGTADVSATR